MQFLYANSAHPILHTLSLVFCLVRHHVLPRWSCVIIKAGFHFRRHFGHHIMRFCARSLFWLAVTAAILFSVVALILRYAVLPNIESHQADIISRFSIATGMDVSVHAIRGQSWM